MSLESIKTDAWRTAGARYNAARRLQRRDVFSTVSLALFSAIGIALAVIQKVYKFEAGSAADNYLTALSVCLSLFILVVALVEWGSQNAVKADRLHQNAEELNQFWRKVQFFDNEKSAVDAYNRIKAKCPVNHEPIDDRLFVANHRDSVEFIGYGYEWFHCLWFAFRGAWSGVVWFVVSWGVVATLLWKLAGAV